ncbi:MAG: 50S ribosomal protein L23 [Deltaproteobacteria bacterium]|nr:50S ribosomal protein L23 [Deltaproteobacteria bacterium]
MKELHRVLKRPVLSEKADLQRESDRKYCFEVEKTANKMDVRMAVESLFKVKVASVNTEVVRGKDRRVGRTMGRRPNWKKACVTLQEGFSIDLFEGV